MRGFAVSTCLALAVSGWLASAPSARAADRTADQILKDIGAVEMPQPDLTKRNDREYINQFIAQRQKAMTRKADLIGELYKAAPDCKELTDLMPERWQGLLGQGPKKADEVKAEIADIQAKSNSALKANAGFFRAVVALQLDHNNAEFQKAADDFVKADPKDPKGATLLNVAAGQTEDSARQNALYKQIRKDYPESREAKSVEAKLRQAESIGKPFEIEFTDAIKGTEISMKTLKGKVVVVDFWATWCGPCVAEMPNMKKLYAEYKDKGVEFVGVSLDRPRDQGGFDSLKAFVAKNEITWPQYYEGKTSAGDFATSWGIEAIPSLFVVDADGKLASVNARGKLESLIPELLKKAKDKGKSDTGAGGN